MTRLLCKLVFTFVATSAFSQTVIQGAGATFPAPLYAKWASAFQQAQPGVEVLYRPLGSGPGVKAFQDGRLDFGATDIPMTAQEKAQAQGAVIHLPVTLGAVALGYHLPGVEGLRLSPEVLAGMFLGQIRRWSDDRITAINPGKALPDLEITAAYRSDASGTTAVFTDYLCKVNTEWNTKIGRGTLVKFPVGMAAKGNEGVAAAIKGRTGSIGYLELSHAVHHQLGVAVMQNRAGNYISPNPESVSSAAANKDIPDDLCLSITDSPGPRDYPIATLSYLVVYQRHSSPAQGRALVDFLRWTITKGQDFSIDLHYAPVPEVLVTRLEEKISSIVF